MRVTGRIQSQTHQPMWVLAGSAHVQGLALSWVGSKDMDDSQGTVVVAEGARNPGNSFLQCGNAQDADNPTVVRNAGNVDLVAAIADPVATAAVAAPPPVDPVAAAVVAAAVAPILIQPIAVVPIAQPVTAAAPPPARTNSPPQECPGCWDSPVIRWLRWRQ